MAVLALLAGAGCSDGNGGASELAEPDTAADGGDATVPGDAADAEPLPGPLGLPMARDDITRVGVATVDITPVITETFTDIDGDATFDGCLDLSPDPALDRPRHRAPAGAAGPGRRQRLKTGRSGGLFTVRYSGTAFGRGARAPFVIASRRRGSRLQCTNLDVSGAPDGQEQSTRKAGG